MNHYSRLLLSLSLLSTPFAVATGANAQSYAAVGSSFSEAGAEETVIGRYDLPSAPSSLRTEYTSFDNPEVSLAATYDTSFGVYLGAGVAESLSDKSGVLTANESSVLFGNVGYERFLSETTVVGVDYKFALGNDAEKLSGFVGFTF